MAAYGAANAAASIAYVPLLVLILPLKVEQIDASNKLELLSITLICGAITASLTNIAAGWISDQLFARYRTRMPQVAGGLVALFIAYFVFSQTTSPSGLIGTIVFFQAGLNFLYSPLGALLADKIPHHAKGRTSALLNLGFPIGTLAVAVLSHPLFRSEAEQLWAIAAIVLILLIPLFFVAGHQPDLKSEAERTALSAPPKTQAAEPPFSKDLFWAWAARFSVQVSGAVIFGYVLYFLQDVVLRGDELSGDGASQLLGQMTLVATPAAIASGLLIGYYSDRLASRKLFLLGAAITVAISLLVMSLWPYDWLIFAAYIGFNGGFTAYVTMDATIVSQLLARSASRARTLGIMNLTNTLPAILAPSLALALNSSELAGSTLIAMMQIAACLALFGLFAASRIRNVG